jgi:hypothetical protein
MAWDAKGKSAAHFFLQVLAATMASSGPIGNRKGLGACDFVR